MNIVTGVFVESALQSAKDDKEVMLLHHIYKLLQNTDVDFKKGLCWDDFEKLLDNPEMQVCLKEVELDPKEARIFFRLMDTDKSGTIDPDELVNGCLHLRGAAKAMDLANLMDAYRHTTQRWHKHARKVEASLAWIMQNCCFPLPLPEPDQNPLALT
eukprot:gnl/TRDRNA2_/TRDRNA2_168515_c1_seq2.p1 gnl/TRDRNA2_/TRDRNA2_168515_c1~~gnl/TRDRNA2_/TRDRNA2_168515_c1_seq2.p1  ORF type:complete len:157 (+),score=39.09 gnl/TRDRNA2_/TRDRNA2_168515_c1_seq2:142-612(+)